MVAAASFPAHPRRTGGKPVAWDSPPRTRWPAWICERCHIPAVDPVTRSALEPDDPARAATAPCCASARSQEPRPRPRELPLNPESNHIREYRPQGTVGRARVRPARRRETLPGLPWHASPPLGQVPRQRERQATRRLAAAVLRGLRPDLEGARPRTRPRPVAGARPPAGIRDQRPGHGARADHERVARREERIPPRLDRHLGTRDGHTLLPARRT